MWIFILMGEKHKEDVKTFSLVDFMILYIVGVYKERLKITYLISAYSTKNESYRYLCNHRRAYKLFTDSLSPKCKFTAFPCESYEKFESGQCFSCGGEVNLFKL